MAERQKLYYLTSRPVLLSDCGKGPIKLLFSRFLCRSKSKSESGKYKLLLWSKCLLTGDEVSLACLEFQELILVSCCFADPCKEWRLTLELPKTIRENLSIGLTYRTSRLIRFSSSEPKDFI